MWLMLSLSRWAWQGEQAVREQASEQRSSVVSASNSCLEFQPWLPPHTEGL